MADPRKLISFSRLASQSLLDALVPGGELHWLLDLLLNASERLDVQIRGSAKADGSHVTAYHGLTAVLSVHELGGRFRLDVHDTHRRAAQFEPGLATPQSAAQLSQQAEAVDSYLQRILTAGTVDPRYVSREGGVQTLLAAASTPRFSTLQREAVPAFVSRPVKDALVHPLRERIYRAATPSVGAPAWWPMVRDRGARPHLGLEADLLGIDPRRAPRHRRSEAGRRGEGHRVAPAQARIYAETFAMWLELDEDARESLVSMADQRASLGLPTPRGRTTSPVRDPSAARRGDRRGQAQPRGAGAPRGSQSRARRAPELVGTATP
jgi:hypothetical protein